MRQAGVERARRLLLARCRHRDRRPVRDREDVWDNVILLSTFAVDSELKRAVTDPAGRVGRGPSDQGGLGNLPAASGSAGTSGPGGRQAMTARRGRLDRDKGTTSIALPGTILGIGLGGFVDGNCCTKCCSGITC